MVAKVRGYKALNADTGELKVINGVTKTQVLLHLAAEYMAKWSVVVVRDPVEYASLVADYGKPEDASAKKEAI